jgi:hypothetical protein
MAWYNTGTIALTNGSATVTGSGTNFLVGAQIGEALYAPDGKLYEIQTINSATVITLASNYLGSTASTQGYQIIPTQSLVADLASDVTDLISDFADVRDYAGNGKFNDGAVGTPGITFTQDQDNGLYRIGSNNWALAAGGQQVVNLTTTAMNFPDNNKAIFGAGSDLEIYHNGSHSFISDVGTGRLYLQGTDGVRVTNASAVNMISAVSGDGVYSYYNGGLKLATTATGIDVTGTVTADGLAVDGDSTVDAITYTASSSFPTTGVSLNSNGFSYEMAGTQGKIFRSASNTKALMQISNDGDISFYEDTGTTPKFFWDSSTERLGIGTSSPSQTLETVGSIFINAPSGNPDITIKTAGTGNNPFVAYRAGDNIVFDNMLVASAATDYWRVGYGASGAITDEHLVVTSAGNVGIGTTSPTMPLSVKAASNAFAISMHGRSDGYSELYGASNDGSTKYAFLQTHSAQTKLYTLVNTPLLFGTNSAERMRIDASGNLLVGASSSPQIAAGSVARIQVIAESSSATAVAPSLPASATGTSIRSQSVTAAGTGWNHFVGSSGNGSSLTANNIFIYGNGDIGNTNNSYGAISDAKLKENITDATPKLAGINAVRIVNYNLIDHPEVKQLGVIAQELEQIFPKMVSETPDRDMEGNDLGTVTKSVKYSVFVPMLIKAMQEQQAIIEALTARIEALES